MKLASRFMPEYKPKKGSQIALFLFACVFLVVFYYSPIVLVVFVAIVILAFVWSYFEQPKIDAYFAKLLEERKGLSICNFAREFNAREVDTWIIRATYEEVQKSICTKQPIPLKAHDHLFETLKLDEDDLDLDLVEIISQRTGRSLAQYENNPFYGKVTTVRNLVLFLNCQPESSAI
jgi:hypothetical protein